MQSIGVHMRLGVAPLYDFSIKFNLTLAIAFLSYVFPSTEISRPWMDYDTLCELKVSGQGYENRCMSPGFSRTNTAKRSISVKTALDSLANFP